MNSKGEISSSTAERKVKKEAASVIPVKRKLVKTMAVEAIISAFSPCSSRTSDHSNGNGHGKGNGGRVYPTHP
ncbi:hypothetical protein IGI04_022827 [Brassica rapa subsp. trilocularis]|uniref:Uncharacterized protein n=3 Tax=Brassica TaxID=3705 RepID=A0A3P5YEZ1_BRACM|nr:hypothetical protein IGI04_022827 [Brassica rapa subsp. trilocularis]CAF2084754.1 unnamed protein product [Brassica napus]CAG7869608.1 unnamed protein product [Brassica rapa]CDY50247.1 BnaA06g15240D [Brassica napus]VDC66312.1 unnamed protein product [Brassica rapa]